MILDRWNLLSLISLQLARFLALPNGLIDSLVLVAGVRLYLAYPPSALAACVCRSSRSTTPVG